MVREFFNLKLSRNPTSGVVGLHQRRHGVRLAFDSRSESQCKLVHQGILLVALVTSVAEKQDILVGWNPNLHRSFHLNLFHYVVPTNPNYRDDGICCGCDSHRGGGVN